MQALSTATIELAAFYYLSLINTGSNMVFTIHELELSEQAGIQGLSQGPFDMIHGC